MPNGVWCVTIERTILENKGFAFVIAFRPISYNIGTSGFNGRYCQFPNSDYSLPITYRTVFGVWPFLETQLEV